MKFDYIVSGIFMLVLGMLINSSVNNGSPFDVYDMCEKFSFLQPCSEKLELLGTLSFGIMIFGTLVFIYGLAAPPHKIEKRVEEVIIKEKRERIDEPERVYVRCQSCGKLNLPDAIYCKWCGQPMQPMSSKQPESESLE